MSDFIKSKLKINQIVAKDDLVFVAIDGSPTYQLCRKLGITIDYNRLHDYFAEQSKLEKISFYISTIEADFHGHLKKLIDWLRFHDYQVVEKRGEKIFERGSFIKSVRLPMDDEIIKDSLEMAGFVKHLILFSDNRALIPLVSTLKKTGLIVTVVSAVQENSQTNPLFKAANHFIDIQDIAPMISRAPSFVSAHA